MEFDGWLLIAMASDKLIHAAQSLFGYLRFVD